MRFFQHSKGAIGFVSQNLLLFALFSFGGPAVEAIERPNIVFMMADDHTSQAWSCYGGRLAAYAKTPNIDRLAAEGALLKNCFCVNSISVSYTHLTLPTTPYV